MMSTLERLKDRFDGAQEEVAPTDRVPFIFPTYLHGGTCIRVYAYTAR